MIFPHQPGIESYIEHVADFLMPEKSKEEQLQHMKEMVIPVKLEVGDATSEDYLDSYDWDNATLKSFLAGSQLEAYVDGQRAGAFAQKMNCDYPSKFHELFFRVKNKVHFHHFCEEFGLPTIPDSIAAGMEGNYEAQCKDIFEAIQSIFKKGYSAVMIRQAIAAGGIGNARIDKIGEKAYKVARAKNTLNGDEALFSWLHDEFHKKSRYPGMMVAPFFGEGTSISGIVEVLEDGEILVPYLGQELLNAAGTSFQGVKIDNDLPEQVIQEGVDMLYKLGEALKRYNITPGRLQMDMRTVNGKVCAVESNAMRKTAVIELSEIMAESKDWIREGAKRLKNRDQKAFVAAEHTKVNDDFRKAIEEKGFYEAFNQFRRLTPEQVRAHLDENYEGEDLDLGVILHASTPPHFFDEQMYVGFIIADKAIRPKLGEPEIKPLDGPLEKLNLDEKWDLMKKVFTKQ